MSALGLPPNLISLFAPRQPLKYLAPCDSIRKKPVYTGLAEVIDHFETDPPPPKEPFETPAEKKARKKLEVLEEHLRRQSALIADYDPNTQPSATKNPFATLFVGRLSYETTEKKLKKEFERYGPIRKVKIITDLEGKSRGYAFVEYDSESDLKKAYKLADGTKVDGRRVLVDVERARTVPKWLPRRLGGGKGPARFAEPKKKGRSSAMPASTSFPPPSSADYRSKPPVHGDRDSGTPARPSYGGPAPSYIGRDSRSSRDYGSRSSYGAPRTSPPPSSSRYSNRSGSPPRDRVSRYGGSGGPRRGDDNRRY